MSGESGIDEESIAKDLEPVPVTPAQVKGLLHLFERNYKALIDSPKETSEQELEKRTARTYGIYDALIALGQNRNVYQIRDELKKP